MARDGSSIEIQALECVGGHWDGLEVPIVSTMDALPVVRRADGSALLWYELREPDEPVIGRYVRDGSSLVWHPA